MGTWDPHGVKRLKSIREELCGDGLDDLLHQAVVDVWQANRARHEPDELFDDSFTLGVTSTRNLANRLAAGVRNDPRWRTARVSATREYGAAVLHVNGLDFRLVKARSTAGRHPNFLKDFDWQSGEMRQAAAARNRAAYGPAPRNPSMAALFEIEQPDAATAVQACHDVFLVWGADLVTGLTAGWLGLPTTSKDRWLAVIPLWWDESTRYEQAGRDDRPSGDTPGFEDQPAPIPTITLKPRRQEADAP